MSFRRGRSTAFIVVPAVLGALMAGCSSNGDTSQLGPVAASAVTAAQAQEVLNVRAAALRDHDLKAFLGTIDQADPKLVKRQRRYFANIAELPLQTFDYTVLKAGWPAGLRSRSWGRDVFVPQVRVETQLAGFDTVPVRRITGFAFGRVHGRPVVVSELTGAAQQYPGSNPSPWDLVRIHVRTDGQTLQVYDNGTWHEAAQIDSVLQRGIIDVQKGLPFAWDGRAVVYVFSRKVVLNSFDGVPGGNIEHLGAMTFPIYADLGQPSVAGTRFTLLPSSVAAGQPFLNRITRHELTHVAVGERDDGDPVWFAEGLAEYMGARSIRKVNRRIPTVAIVRARAGVNAMPASATFNGPDQAWHYALSWMACDYIAATQGEAKLWELMDALHAGGAGTTDEAQDPVLIGVLGFDSEELARRAAARILHIYG